MKYVWCVKDAAFGVSGKAAHTILAGAGYDEEARYFEDTVRRAKEEELIVRSQRLVSAAFADQLGLLRQAALARTVAALAQPDAQHDFAACASRCAAICTCYFWKA